ncbi:cilia- and flagella-associated protein 20 isoform X1 [Artibeus jamaicensis]|uniref:cilia- and flagella-associated protein 20 isoform X1 n=1 Tax=Artibeus jamaicensis TaxID=9417 RepID=UPI00235A67CA|nr:cilia- and flagella-associated protein 20 isoform X1 [Artibeus jamaicensis]
MFKNTFQSGFLSILYSIGSKPLQIWDKKVRNGHIKRITDNDIQSLVLEIEGTNVSTTYITCPADPKKTLGIKLPFLVMIIKNLKKYFTFEVQVLDDKNVRRRFRASNYQSTTRVKPFICTMPMRLDEGWNQIQFNLSDFTRRAYGTNYIETLRVQSCTPRSTPTVASDGSTSQTDCTQKMNCQQSSNSTSRCRTRRSNNWNAMKAVDPGPDSCFEKETIWRTMQKKNIYISSLCCGSFICC